MAQKRKVVGTITNENWIMILFISIFRAPLSLPLLLLAQLPNRHFKRVIDDLDLLNATYQMNVLVVSYFFYFSFGSGGSGLFGGGPGHGGAFGNWLDPVGMLCCALRVFLLPQEA